MAAFPRRLALKLTWFDVRNVVQTAANGAGTPAKVSNCLAGTQAAPIVEKRDG